MIVSTKTTLSFKMPDEYKQMVQYEKENPDWKKHETTLFISFTKEQAYSVELKDGDTE